MIGLPISLKNFGSKRSNDKRVDGVDGLSQQNVHRLVKPIKFIVATFSYNFRHGLVHVYSKDTELKAEALKKAIKSKDILISEVKNSGNRQVKQYYTGQNEVLERLAKGHSLDDILTRIAQITEHQMPGMIASFLLYNPITKCLHHGTAPNLPDAYTKAIDGLRIGERVGPCGTAAHQGKSVIVDDIESDPRWEVFRDIALKHNLRACWSHPIISTEGRLLGTFAMYDKTPHSPQPSDSELIRKVAKLAAIAINGKQQEKALHSIAAETASVTGSEFFALACTPYFGRPACKFRDTDRMEGSE